MSVSDDLARKLEGDLSDRRGLKWEWNAIDDDIKEEIRSKWRGLFNEALEQAAQTVEAEAPCEQGCQVEAANAIRALK